MCSNYMSKSLNEYNKVIATINSCKNEDHLDSAVNMANAFINNCNYRLDKLDSIFTSKQFNQLNNFVESAIAEITTYINCWKEAYSEWVQEQQRLEEEAEEIPEKIRGYGCLFKKTKRK